MWVRVTEPEWMKWKTIEWKCSRSGDWWSNTTKERVICFWFTGEWVKSYIQTVTVRSFGSFRSAGFVHSTDKVFLLSAAADKSIDGPGLRAVWKKSLQDLRGWNSLKKFFKTWKKKRKHHALIILLWNKFAKACMSISIAVSVLWAMNFNEALQQAHNKVLVLAVWLFSVYSLHLSHK